MLHLHKSTCGHHHYLQTLLLWICPSVICCSYIKETKISINFYSLAMYLQRITWKTCTWKDSIRYAKLLPGGHSDFNIDWYSWNWIPTVFIHIQSKAKLKNIFAYWFAKNSVSEGIEFNRSGWVGKIRFKTPGHLSEVLIKLKTHV